MHLSTSVPDQGFPLYCPLPSTLLSRRGVECLQGGVSEEVTFLLGLALEEKQQQQEWQLLCSRNVLWVGQVNENFDWICFG